MAGGKETPRQKMIGMMYLVLTALLALNVSKSILDAFVTQDEQAIDQNTNIVQNVNALKANLSLLKNDPQAKKTAAEIEPLINNIGKHANEIDDHFLSELNQLFVNVEGKEWFDKNDETQITTYEDFNTMKKMDDYDAPSNYFGGIAGTESYQRGQALRTKLMEYRDKIILESVGTLKDKGKVYTISEDNLSSLETFKTHLESIKHPKTDVLINVYERLTKDEKIMQHEEEKDWNIARFYHQPMIGVVGTMTSLRNDIRLAQLDVSKLLMERVEEPLININKVEPQVLASTSYINAGDKLDVKVGIVAYDSTKQYPIRYRTGENGSFVESDSNYLTITGGSTGEQTLNGELDIEIGGIKQHLPWSFTYSVGKPTGAIATPELNVLYKGYNNQIIATASGYDPKDVRVSCSGCSIGSPDGKGIRIAKVGSGKTATIYVKSSDGKTLAQQEFKIKPLPTPNPYCAGQSFERSAISRGKLSTAPGLSAKLPDASPLSLRYTITSFKIIGVKSGQVFEMKSNGSKFSSQMKTYLKKIKTGQRVTIEQIKAKGPDGKTRNLPPLVWKVV